MAVFISTSAPADFHKARSGLRSRRQNDARCCNVMDLTSINQHPHIRFNPLRREWVQVSPKRTDRPWQGQIETGAQPSVPSFDPGCYLCPGNTRARGVKNPGYDKTFAFDNDFPALIASVPDALYSESDLLIARAEAGVCRVVCFSP